MYDLIEKKRSVRKLYTEALIGRGDITVEDAEEVMTKFQQRLESVFKEVRNPEAKAKDVDWNRVPVYPAKEAAKHGTAITVETLKKIADAHTTFPDGFTVHPKVMPQLQRRAAAITQGPIDWATGEILALGSLLLDGRTVRLTGQDSRRGTFVQRFASIVDRKTGESWVPLKHLDEEQGKFHIFDSLLSEFAAMGFEYGYSVANPEALVLWEAQFGDFANGAQTIIDEFITSGQAKWTQKSGVVLLLPARLRGPGPGPLVRADRALAAAGGGGRVHGGPAVDPGQPLPHAAPAGPRRDAPAADRLHPEVDAAQQAGRLRSGRLHPGLVEAGAGRSDHRRPEPGHLGDPLLGQGALGPGQPADRRGTGRQGGDHVGGAALPAAGQADRRLPEPVRERPRGPLGAGRAEQPGRLAVHRAQPAARCWTRRCPTGWKLTPVTRPASSAPGGRLGQGARGAAAGADGRGVRLTGRRRRLTRTKSDRRTARRRRAWFDGTTIVSVCALRAVPSRSD